MRRPLAFKCFIMSLSAACINVTSTERLDDRVLTDLDVHTLVICDRFDEFTSVV